MNELEKLKKREEERKNRNLNIGLVLSLLSIFFSFIFPTPGIVVGCLGVMLCSKSIGTKRYKYARAGMFAGGAGIVIGILAAALSEYVRIKLGL